MAGQVRPGEGGPQGGQVGRVEAAAVAAAISGLFPGGQGRGARIQICCDHTGALAGETGQHFPLVHAGADGADRAFGAQAVQGPSLSS